jgi:hypothetical protein
MKALIPLKINFDLHFSSSIILVFNPYSKMPLHQEITELFKAILAFENDVRIGK